MGRKKSETARSPEIAIRLTMPDYNRLSELSVTKGTTRTDLVREAVIEYLNRIEAKVEERVSDQVAQRLFEIEERLAAQHKKDTERLAKISSRCLIDVALINQILYSRADKQTRDKMWEDARNKALMRLNVGKKQGDPVAAELAKDALSGEA